MCKLRKALTTNVYETVPSRKGSPNKRTYKFPQALDVCERRKINPFEVMADFMINGETDDLRLRAAKEMATYLQAKPVHVHVEHINPPVLTMAIESPKTIEGFAKEIPE